MENISEEAADYLHESKINCYSISVSNDDKNVYFTINLLNEVAEKIFSYLVLDKEIDKIVLNNSIQKEFLVLNKQIEELTAKQLTRNFYEGISSREVVIDIMSPMSFKVQGDYYFFPDLELMFRNLMQKYNATFENTNIVDNDLLQEILENSKIVSYKIQSSYYPIHKAFIPGTIGRIKIRFKGNQTLTNYTQMLLNFGVFSGIGVKTGMGMGYISITK